jgi:hypothetical protein
MTSIDKLDGTANERALLERAGFLRVTRPRGASLIPSYATISVSTVRLRRTSGI